MSLRSVSRVAVFLVTLFSSAARLHAHTNDAPDTLAQEVNQCLRLVNLAASRRDSSSTKVPSRFSIAYVGRCD
jgi:hypothetical protein